MKAAGEEKAPEPRRKLVRVWLDEEDFGLLEKDAEDSQRSRARQAEVLLRNAIRSATAYAYEFNTDREFPAVKSARAFFTELGNLQAAALEEIQSAGRAAEAAAREAAVRCQHWLDADKAHRTRAVTGPKVLAGEFRPAPKGLA